MTVLVNKMNVFRTNIHFGLCTTLPDHVSSKTLKDAPCLRSENVFRKKVAGKKKYVRGKRDHKLTAPGRTVWVVRTGRRGEEEVERVCSDRHET